MVLKFSKQSQPHGGITKVNDPVSSKIYAYRIMIDLVDAAKQLLILLLERPNRKTIRLISMLADQVNMEPMDAVKYSLNIWRTSIAHFSEDAHYDEGDREIPAIGMNGILFTNLDWRPEPKVCGRFRMSMVVVNATSAALSVALAVLQRHRSSEIVPYGDLGLCNSHQSGFEGLHMFLHTVLDTIRISQSDRGINMGQEFGLALGMDILLSKDLCLWTFQGQNRERLSSAPLLHPARRVLGSLWRAFCLHHGIGNEFITGSIPPRYGMLEFRIPGILNKMCLEKRERYMWMSIKDRQVRSSLS